MVNDVSFGVNKIDVPADVAADGSLVYVREKLAPPAGTLIWLSRDGKPEQALPERRAYEPDNFSLSPDGRRVATTIDSDGRSNIWICDLSDRLCRLLSIQADCIAPVWSPSGDRLVFSSNLEGAYNLYVVAVNDNHRPERLGPSSRMLQRPRSWSSDGRFLAYEVQGTAAPYETYILRLEGRGAPFRWGPAGAEVSEPAFSPDGRWLAYQSRESGRWEVWVRPFPGPGPSHRVSGGDGGLAPVWEGREIYYVERLGGTRIMSRRVESIAPFRLASAPRVAFALPFALSNDLFYFSLAYAVEPGGHRLLVVQPDERAPVNALNVITRWPEEVKAKLRRDHHRVRDAAAAQSAAAVADSHVMTNQDRQDITGMLAAWNDGDARALDGLIALVYPTLRQLAHQHLERRRPGESVESAALANETYLKLVRAGGIRCENRAHFLALCAQIMRRLLVDHARHRGFAKHGGNVLCVELDEALLTARERGIEVLALDEALETLARLDPRKSRVELRYFGGLDMEEVAEVLGVSLGTVKRDWRLARAWLFRELTGGRDDET